MISKIPVKNHGVAYELFGMDNNGITVSIGSRKRTLIGKSNSCDVVIRDESVSDIHAVIEHHLNGVIKIFDMNSVEGTFINDKKIIVGEIKAGDIVGLGSTRFTFRAVDEVPPALEKVLPEIPGSIEVSKEATEYEDPFPMSHVDNAEGCEYIFEDENNIYPIFDYRGESRSVEIIISSKGRILSIHHLEIVDKRRYYLTGNGSTENGIYYWPFSKKESTKFIEIRNGDIYVIRPEDHKATYLGLKSPVSAVPDHLEEFFIEQESILKLEYSNADIFIRETNAPPSVKVAPIFRRDDEYRNVVLSICSLLILFIILINFIEVKKVEKDVPDRVATILYRPKVIKRIKPIKKKIQGKKAIVRKNKQSKSVKKIVKKTPLSKRMKTVAKKKDVLFKNRKIVKKIKTFNGTMASSRKSIIKNTKVGHIDAFKASKFRKILNKALAKGGGVKRLKVDFADIGSGGRTDLALRGSTKETTVKKIKHKDFGSFNSGSKMVNNKSLSKGLNRKKTSFYNSDATRTVIKGAIDASLVKRLLAEHVNQFRYCYQSHLDSQNRRKGFIVNLNFVIGASGHASDVVVNTKFRGLNDCFERIVGGINFPKPYGGGVVEVKQPLNLYAREGSK
ncbi:FHA domain-containing protein [Bacteriovoracaceae bacterium]|nr:FHA domain-containing protein [Bacteriovoracaceae bacterium]